MVVFIQCERLGCLVFGDVGPFYGHTKECERISTQKRAELRALGFLVGD